MNHHLNLTRDYIMNITKRDVRKGSLVKITGQSGYGYISVEIVEFGTHKGKSIFYHLNAENGINWEYVSEIEAVIAK